MKLSARILMGILFPFILIITVTTISKALKPEKTQVNKEIPTENPSEITEKSSVSIPVSVVVYKEK